MVSRLPKAFVSWSSGKDSAYALLETRRQSIAEIVGILTTIDATDDRVAVHGVRSGLLTRQAAALGLPLIRVELPHPCPNEPHIRFPSRWTARPSGASLSNDGCSPSAVVTTGIRGHNSSAEIGRAEDRRGDFGAYGQRSFPIPAHQTERADFRHSAFRLASTQGPRWSGRLRLVSCDDTSNATSLRLVV